MAKKTVEKTEKVKDWLKEGAEPVARKPVARVWERGELSEIELKDLRILRDRTLISETKANLLERLSKAEEDMEFWEGV